MSGEECGLAGGAEGALDEEGFSREGFDTVAYINALFPTEQSLGGVDGSAARLEWRLAAVDSDIQALVRGQQHARIAGHAALQAAHCRIHDLAVQVRDINAMATRSEECVREITGEIRQLDCAKTNLTSAITALNHLHMLVGGITTLRALADQHRYKEVVLPLQAISEVTRQLAPYEDIAEIRALRDRVESVRAALATQILDDFRSALQPGLAGAGSHSVSHRTLAEACGVVDVLEMSVRDRLLAWLVELQLQEYTHLFAGGEEAAWLDKVERRYAWLKRHLLAFEEKLAAVFPEPWAVSERIAARFCVVTREELGRQLAARRQDLDVKLLLYAVHKTHAFEQLLDKRFTGATLQGATSPAVEVGDGAGEAPGKSAWTGQIGACFEPYLYLYIESLDTNLRELMERFVQEARGAGVGAGEEAGPGAGAGAVLTSCADLFLFYKKCMVQCAHLTTGEPMLELAGVFQKYLREYCTRVLGAALPGAGAAAVPGGAATRALHLVHNFHTLLRDDTECLKLSPAERARVASVMTTAEYCVETAAHLQSKLRDKLAGTLAPRVDLAPECELFHKLIDHCIQLLVQDLELQCEPALAAMSRAPWSSVTAVGDQSPYVSSITGTLRATVPALRDHLASSRKYFTQLCIRFANSFIGKFIAALYRCAPMCTEGAEQLLLDTHMLKTALLELPSTGSDVKRAPPQTYTKVVVKLMSKAEMILKLVMSPLELEAGGAGLESFVAQVLRLVPECSLQEFRRLLDMKGVRLSKQQLAHADSLFKERAKQLSADLAK